MDILELKEKLLNLRSEMENLINAGEVEARELNETENGRLAEIRSEMDSINAEIEEINRNNEKIAKENNNNINNRNISKSMEKVTLVDLINGVVEGRSFNEAEARFVDGKKINTRAAIQAQVEGNGEENVPEDKMGLDVAIRNASVLNKIGCTWFGNAVGDLSLPKYHGSSVLWKGEIASAEDGAGVFSETILQPKRLTATVDVSLQFLRQDRNDAEAILIKDLAAAIAEKLDKTVFGDAASGSTVPGGLFYSADTKAVSALTYDDILSLEESVEEHNGTDFIFITNPKFKYALKGVQMASGLEMVYSKNEIDGYKAVVSNSVKGIACMDPRDLAVAQWGGVEITVDPYTKAAEGQVRLVVNAFYDAKMRGDRAAFLGEE